MDGHTMDEIKQNELVMSSSQYHGFHDDNQTFTSDRNLKLLWVRMCNFNTFKLEKSFARYTANSAKHYNTYVAT